MSRTLTEIAEQLKDNNKKVKLIYAFNGVGKTRLSKQFQNLVTPEVSEDQTEDQTGLENKNIIYYNAFTEDLFNWDNDLDNDIEPKLKIKNNFFTKWIFQELGQDQNIFTYFHEYINKKYITPKFNDDFNEVSFSIEKGTNESISNIKISKGEESCFIWSIFYFLILSIIDDLNECAEKETETSKFNKLEYIFIDDPVTSLDENHLIQLAVDIAQIIKASKTNLKFIITTHNPTFYNILYNELDLKKKKKGELNERSFMLESCDNGLFELVSKDGDSNRSFSYHLNLKNDLKEAIENKQIERNHFTSLRNLYEKTASFLGYEKWSDLLPGDKKLYYNRILQFTNHSTVANDTIVQPTPQEKRIIEFLYKHLEDNYSYYKEKKDA